MELRGRIDCSRIQKFKVRVALECKRGVVLGLHCVRLDEKLIVCDLAWKGSTCWYPNLARFCDEQRSSIVSEAASERELLLQCEAKGFPKDGRLLLWWQSGLGRLQRVFAGGAERTCKFEIAGDAGRRDRIDRRAMSDLWMAEEAHRDEVSNSRSGRGSHDNVGSLIGCNVKSMWHECRGGKRS